MNKNELNSELIPWGLKPINKNGRKIMQGSCLLKDNWIKNSMKFNKNWKRLKRRRKKQGRLWRLCSKTLQLWMAHSPKWWRRWRMQKFVMKKHWPQHWLDIKKRWNCWWGASINSLIRRKGDLACQMPKFWIEGASVKKIEKITMWASETCEKTML